MVGLQKTRLAMELFLPRGTERLFSGAQNTWDRC
jgi:hypothetical protein